MTRPSSAPRRSRAAPRSPVRYRDYLQALLRGDRRACQQQVDALLEAGTSLQTLYIDWFQRSLQDVGVRWERGLVSVGVEHLATAISEMLMVSVASRVFSKSRVGRSALVACVGDERHVVGARMVADLFETHGWDAHFVGGPLPVDALVDLAVRQKVDVVALSVSLTQHLAALPTTMEAVHRAMPNARVIVGGAAFLRAPLARRGQQWVAELGLERLDKALASGTVLS